MDRISKNHPAALLRHPFHGLKPCFPHDQRWLTALGTWIMPGTWQLPFDLLLRRALHLCSSSRPAISRKSACGQLPSSMASPWLSPDTETRVVFWQSGFCGFKPLDFGLRSLCWQTCYSSGAGTFFLSYLFLEDGVQSLPSASSEGQCLVTCSFSPPSPGGGPHLQWPLMT